MGRNIVACPSLPLGDQPTMSEFPSAAPKCCCKPASDAATTCCGPAVTATTHSSAQSHSHFIVGTGPAWWAVKYGKVSTILSPRRPPGGPGRSAGPSSGWVTAWNRGSMRWAPRSILPFGLGELQAEFRPAEVPTSRDRRLDSRSRHPRRERVVCGWQRYLRDRRVGSPDRTIRPGRVRSKHQTVIVPQLGAPGVAAHEVKKANRDARGLWARPGRGLARLPEG